MGLPKIDIPTFTTNLPSTDQAVVFRPFLVKEEKILLIAQQGEDSKEQISAVKQIINNCVQSEINLETMPIFDLEWLFLQLRIKSVSDKVTLKFRHTKTTECNHIYEYELDLNEVKMKFSDDHNKEVKITDSISVFLKYPNIETATLDFNPNDLDSIIEFITSGIEFIKDGETYHETKDYKPEEVREFLEQLSQEQMLNIQKFYETQPSLSHTIAYTCPKCGVEEEATLRSLQDFLG